MYVLQCLQYLAFSPLNFRSIVCVVVVLMSKIREREGEREGDRTLSFAYALLFCHLCEGLQVGMSLSRMSHCDGVCLD